MCKHVPGFTMRRKRRRRRRRYKRVCVDNAASRAPRNRVISAARPNTCPIIFCTSALARRRMRRPGDKGFPCFWYRQLHPPTRPSWSPFRLSSLLSPSNRLFPFFFFNILSPNEPREYQCARGWERKRKKKKRKGGCVKRARWLQLFAATVVCRFNELAGRGARNPFGRESACALEKRIIALCLLLAAKGEKDSATTARDGYAKRIEAIRNHQVLC